MAGRTETGAETETVAVLGAGGIMGFPIARNIARAGFAVRAWNRTRSKAEPLADDGAHIAETPADAARGAGIVLTMLADADADADAVAVAAAMDGPDGALGVMPGGNAEPGGDRTDDPFGPHHALWVQMSTVGEEGTTRCAELANGRGVGFVDAPVLGTKQPAEAGQLVILESGPEEARPRTQPVFDAIGLQDDPGALAEELGLDPALFFGAIEGGGLDLPYPRMKGKAMTERDFEPSFPLRLAAGVKVHGDLDLSATYLTSAPDRETG